MLRLALLLVMLAPQDVAWRTNWKETLAEAKKSNKLALLVFWNAGVKNWKQFEADTLSDANTKQQLGKFICCKIDPEGTDDENKLWQEHKSCSIPTTFVYDPEGKMLTTVTALNTKIYWQALAEATPAYFEKILPARQALAKDPNQPEKLAMLGDAYAKLNVPAESKSAYDKAAETAVAKGDKAGAIRILVQQLDQYYELGKMWYASTRTCAGKLIELDGSNSTKKCHLAAFVLCMADYSEAKWQEAIAGLRAATVKYPDNDLLDKMYLSLGAAHGYAKEYDKAREAYETVMKKFVGSDSAKLAEIQLGKLPK